MTVRGEPETRNMRPGDAAQGVPLPPQSLGSMGDRRSPPRNATKMRVGVRFRIRCSCRARRQVLRHGEEERLMPYELTSRTSNRSSRTAAWYLGRHKPQHHADVDETPAPPPSRQPAPETSERVGREQRDAHAPPRETRRTQKQDGGRTPASPQLAEDNREMKSVCG